MAVAIPAFPGTLVTATIPVGEEAPRWAWLRETLKGLHREKRAPIDPGNAQMSWKSHSAVYLKKWKFRPQKCANGGCSVTVRSEPALGDCPSKASLYPCCLSERHKPRDGHFGLCVGGIAFDQALFDALDDSREPKQIISKIPVQIGQALAPCRRAIPRYGPVKRR